jgi:hypothetical protein
MYTLRNGSTTTDPRLDRLEQFDERSRNFPIRTQVPEALTRGRSWPCTPRYDQGREGACVSFAWHHELGAYPKAIGGFTFTAMKERYWEMQRTDEWPGGSYPGASPFYEGTSVLAGAKLMTSAGYYEEYRWAFTVDEVLRAIVHEGPVVLGIPWLDSMYKPRPSGLMDCTGNVAGGHAIMARGVSLKPRLRGEANDEPIIRLRNSWSSAWGQYGDCFVKTSDLERLLKDNGECCVPMQRKFQEV